MLLLDAAEGIQTGASGMRFPVVEDSSAIILTEDRLDVCPLRAVRRAVTTAARWDGLTIMPSWPHGVTLSLLKPYITSTQQNGL